MTDPLTDAVRRLKELQQDVERLQSAEDQEGEPRLFFQTQDQAVVNSAIELTDSDIAQSESARAVDAIAIGPDIIQSETATAEETVDIRARVISDPGVYNSVGYNTSSYNK
jgi:phosphoglycerate dehydrogenase-like enzyme